MNLLVNELFSGIGAQRLALQRLNIPYEVVGISEIDKFSIKSYEGIFGKTRNYGDISKIDLLDYADLWTYSTPCQGFSIAGKQLGLEDGRSSLILEVARLLRFAQANDELPKYLLLENVKNMIGARFRADFDTWIEYLEGLGYNNYWQVLNAKDYNIPQNRERIFVISIRKDIDNKTFSFPKPVDLTIKLQDLLESNVDEKYYISHELEETFKKQIVEKEISNTVRVGGKGSFDKHSWDIVAEPIIGASRGRYTESGSTEQRLELYKQGTSNTITTVTKDNLLIEPPFRIRRLTPRECWRLMSFSDEEFEKASKVCSNTQLYKQAGNSICISVLEAIFKNLFK